jgi:hypothetical protein
VHSASSGLTGFWSNNVSKSITTGSTNGGTFTDANRRVSIGYDRWNNGNYFNGRIHSVAIWDTDVSAARTLIFNNGAAELDLLTDTGAYTYSSNLQHWWRLGLDSTDIGKDHGATPIDVDVNALNISAADIVADYPPLVQGAAVLACVATVTADGTVT